MPSDDGNGTDERERAAASGGGSGRSSSRHPGPGSRGRPGELPVRIGRFEIRGRIGRGGQATVYLAWDPVLQVERALKVIHREGDHDFSERLLAEARTMIRLDHPNIVRVFDVLPDVPCIVMEYCDGGDLERLIKARISLPLGEILSIVEQVASALAAAHGLAVPVIHRDLKPGNILFKQGRPKIADFGLAKIREATGEHSSTSAGLLPGTIYYMAPEQITAPRTIDARVDLWALGVILYELLTWRRPFHRAGESEYFVFRRILEEPPPEPGWAVPPATWRVVRRALEKDRERRYASAGEMVEDLRAAAAALEDPAFPVPPRELLRDEDLLAQLVFAALEEGRSDLARERAARLRREFPGSDLGRYWYNLARSVSSVSRPVVTSSGAPVAPAVPDIGGPVRKFLEQGRLEEAEALLAEHLSRYPGDAAAAALAREVREQVREEAAFRERVRAALREADRLARGGRLREALRALEALGPRGAAEPEVAARRDELRSLADERDERTRRLRVLLREELDLAAEAADRAPGGEEELGTLRTELDRLREELESAREFDALRVLGREIALLRSRLAGASAGAAERSIRDVAAVAARARAILSRPGVEDPALAALVAGLHGGPAPAEDDRLARVLERLESGGETGNRDSGFLAVDRHPVAEGIRDLARRARQAPDLLSREDQASLAALAEQVATPGALGGNRLAQVLRRWVELETALERARRGRAREEAGALATAIDLLAAGPTPVLERRLTAGTVPDRETLAAAEARAEERLRVLAATWERLRDRSGRGTGDGRSARIEACLRAGAWAALAAELAVLASALGRRGGEAEERELQEIAERVTGVLAAAPPGPGKTRELAAFGRALLDGTVDEAREAAARLLQDRKQGVEWKLREPAWRVRRATRRLLPETWAAWERLRETLGREGEGKPARRHELLAELARVRRRMAVPPPLWPRAAAAAATLGVVAAGVYGWQAQRGTEAARGPVQVRLVVARNEVRVEQVGPERPGEAAGRGGVSFAGGEVLPDPEAVDRWIRGSEIDELIAPPPSGAKRRGR